MSLAGSAACLRCHSNRKPRTTKWRFVALSWIIRAGFDNILTACTLSWYFSLPTQMSYRIEAVNSFLSPGYFHTSVCKKDWKWLWLVPSVARGCWAADVWGDGGKQQWWEEQLETNCAINRSIYWFFFKDSKRYSLSFRTETWCLLSIVVQSSAHKDTNAGILRKIP